ncbi:MAG: hypothetical protein A3C90_02150 [Candidatus Magasanikbacteria bacterium RIFCSPHIGHO2_02_FULL_51_14]|uniref:Uncharacterized protein n=1 Tax=Candidatus Magasanikbacteria bacterium RIFCSPHIGHO2_02_FULL_51_14 TaxID=1798683 RepID=A0A1F6MRE1_9BACT|nr:MAG: hypothetical protein A3C90_02150 [Candidatus Magasanikbacteria bacterium RIFCSPHIGHO2_02_FULL_51_14]
MPLISKKKNVRALYHAKEAVRRMVNGKWGNIALIILLAAALVGFVWSFLNYQKTKARFASISAPVGETENTPEAVHELLGQVRRHMLLPNDVDPIVARINDAAGLAAAQAFYKDAQSGDVILVYPEKAIIYSPSRDIIVNTGPVIFERPPALDAAGD